MQRNKCLICPIKDKMNERIKEYFLFTKEKLTYREIINKKLIPNCDGCLNYLDSITFYS